MRILRNVNTYLYRMKIESIGTLYNQSKYKSIISNDIGVFNEYYSQIF